jgi:alanyl-tRNA synthetase
MKTFKQAFLFVDTYGLPLEYVIEHCYARGMVADLRQFMTDAVTAGWSFNHAIATVNEAVNALRNRPIKFIFSKIQWTNK